MTRHLLFLLLLFLGLVPAHAQFTNLSEFHYGYGGFAIRAGDPSGQERVAFDLGEYHVWGNAFLWDGSGHRLRISVCSVARTGTILSNLEKSAVIAKWKDALLKDIDPKAHAKDRPFTSIGLAGTEMTSDSPTPMITRLFFLNSIIIEETIVAQDAVDLPIARSMLDSFRLLNKEERAIAIVGEFTPPPLEQARPKMLPTADATEMGLVGPVKRVWDNFEMDKKADPRSAVRTEDEVYFDRDGFVFVEVSYSLGFPDIITTWGWHGGKRINLQSPISYPPGEGPIGGRSAVVSGSFAIPGAIYTAKGANYGNLIDVRRDEKGRPLEKRRYASSGSLVLVEKYTYSGNQVEIKTVDEAGGFIGWVRNRLDGHNNILESDTLLDNGTIGTTVKYEYQFDEKGNWITKRSFRKGTIAHRVVWQPIGIYHRTISYYSDSETRQLT